tara:strand:- start:85 stop:1002 length:918 start_codon:yes stop_codon:yes gene_type:complete
VIKFSINLLLILYLFSCKTIEKNDDIGEKIESTTNETIVGKKSKKIEKINTKTNNNIFYYVGDPYFIEGVKYTPEENYSYNKTGLATFYSKDLHNVKTINNDVNKVTELLGRHKTLPLPSIVKITNLENGLSVTIKINDRHEDNYSIIQVSRKVAQLLRFYKNTITRVRVEILADPSKQWKSVSISMNEEKFNDTIQSAPTDTVSITNLDDNFNDADNSLSVEEAIEIGNEPINENQLFIKVYNFSSYEEIQKVLNDLNLSIKSTSEKDGNNYNIILGPIQNEDADKLVSSFIMKGYKKTEIILK